MAKNLADLIPAIFTGPDGRPLSEDQIRSRQMIAKSLLQNATDTSPNAGGWASILAKGVQGLAAGYQSGQADRGAEAATAEDAKISGDLGALLGGADSSLTPSSSALPATSGVAEQLAAISPAVPGGPEAYRNAIASIESAGSGDYAAIGPTHPKLGRALGRYQIMESNIGPWSQEALGRAVTPEEFMADPKLQDAIFDKKFSGYVQQYGPEGAAQAWIGGPGGVGKTGRKDSLGTSVGAYGSKFLKALGPQVAAATPEAAIEAVAPASGYVDPQVTTAYASPIPVTSAPLAPVGQMDTVAQALLAPAKGNRIGSPAAISQQNFDDRFGGTAAASTPEIYSQPQDFAQAAAQNDQTVTGALPQSTPQAISQPQLPSAPPLNPAIIKALSSPYASPQTKAVARSLLEQNIAQRRAVDEQSLKIQQRQEALRQRQAVAQSLGIDPMMAADDDAWRQAVGGGNLINAGNGNLYDSRSKQWLTAPNAGGKNFRQATPEEVKAFGTNGQVGPDGKFYPITPPQGTSLSVDPSTGAVSFNQGAGVKPLTEGQSKDTFFNTRMEAALPTLEANENALLNLGGKVADAIPMNLGNYAQSEDYQLARDAGRDFVTAYLRKDSGAAITPQEEKIYGELLLPQPGDKPPTIEAKRQRRKVAVEAIKAGMPQQALDNALRAIKASGGDKAIVPTEIPGVTIRRVN